jgi:hypothetical protein
VSDGVLPETKLQRRILTETAEKYGVNFVEWARRAGISGSTLYNFMNRPNAKSLSWSTLVKLAGVFPSLTPEELAGRRKVQTVLTRSAVIRIKGAVQDGVWQPDYEYDIPDQYMTSIPWDDWSTGKLLFGMDVRGDGMNEIYPEGSILACCSIYQWPNALRSRKHYIVQRYRPDGEVEASCKELIIDKDGASLRPRSTNPSHRPISFAWPIHGFDVEVDGDRVTIAAIVVRSVSPATIT